MATIAVGGASGLIGTALVRHLRDRGDTVLRLVRGAAVQPDEVGWNPAKDEIHLEPCAEVDTLVNLSGAPVSRRWTAWRKRQILLSRVRCTRTLARAATELGPHVALVNASAVGYYGDRGDEVLTESGRRVVFTPEPHGDTAPIRLSILYPESDVVRVYDWMNAELLHELLRRHLDTPPAIQEHAPDLGRAVASECAFRLRCFMAPSGWPGCVTKCDGLQPFMVSGLLFCVVPHPLGHVDFFELIAFILHLCFPHIYGVW